jgi:hypothetical protein
MKLPQTGGCQCGKIRYTISEVPQLVYTCHCTDCQRMTRSAFSLGVALPEGAFRLIAGEPRAIRRVQRQAQHAICLPRLRELDLQLATRRCDPCARWDARRYVMATSDPTYLDPAQAALGHP